MIEGEDDQAYRVHLLNGTWGLLWSRLWGRFIHAREPTYFDGDDVRRRMGKRGWPVDYWDAIRNRKYEIYGQPQGSTEWRPLSRPLVEQARLAQQIADAMRAAETKLAASDVAIESDQAPDPVDDMVETLQESVERASPKPGAGEALVHMIDHTRMRGDHALRVFRRFDEWKAYKRSDFKHLLKGGRDRIKKGEPCRFCPSNTPS